MDKLFIQNSNDSGVKGYDLSKRYIYINSIAFSGIIIFLFFLYGCASKGPISGGPVDDIPPLILNTVPENLSLMVKNDIEVKFEFNERMNRSSVEKAIFISPVPDSKPEYKWNGYKNLTLRFGDELTEDRTYVISIGSAAADEHKIKLGESYNLAFSTGDRIDNGTIAGAVFGHAKKSKVLLFAYLLEDSLDVEPAETNPDYITQPNNNGEYRFMHLAYGRYRVFAVEDLDENGKYFIGKDNIAISTKDDAVLVETDTSATFSFYGFQSIDTLNPVIVSLLTIDNRHLTIRSLEPLVLPDNIDSIWAVSRRDEQKIIPKVMYPDVEEANIFHLHFEGLSDNTEYDIFFGGLKDLSDNKLDSISRKRTFTSSAERDTTPPQLISVTPQRGNEVVYSGDHIKINFDEGIQKESILSALNIFISDSVSVNYDLVSKYPNKWEAFTTDGWKSGRNYKIQMNLEEIRDLRGNSMPDSLWSSKFQVVANDTFGIISGLLVDDLESGVAIHLTASPFNKKAKKLYSKVDTVGNFQFDKVLPGKYFLSAYGDTDEDGNYTLGIPVPYTLSERFFQGIDTVIVRSRWETADHKIIFTEE